MTRPNVFKTPVKEMNRDQVDEAMEQLTGWAEHFGWDQSDHWYEDEPDLTANDLFQKLLDRANELG